MTAPRLARGSRSRFLLYFGILIVLTALVAVYHNTLTQLDAVTKANDVCNQHQESLATQLQMISEYKTRLENSLQTEKVKHKQTQEKLQAEAEDEKSKRDKSNIEANLRFSSLQQQCKLLKTQLDDNAQSCSKVKKQQLSEINALQSKLQELQGQLKQTVNQKDRAFENLKSQFVAIQVQRDDYKKAAEGAQDGTARYENDLNYLHKQNNQLKRELDELKKTCPNSVSSKTASRLVSTIPESTRNFTKTVQVKNDIYQIFDSKNSPLPDNIVDGNLNLIDRKSSTTSTKKDNSNNLPQIDAPNTNLKRSNNMEEFDNKGVLQQPINNKFTPKSTTKSGGKVDFKNNDNMLSIQPLISPKSNIKDNNDSNDNVLSVPNVMGRKAKKQLPVGVVPVHYNNIEEEEKVINGVNSAEQATNNIDPQSNRYRNTILNLEPDKNANEDSVQKPLRRPKQPEEEPSVLDNALDTNLNHENGAIEVVDDHKENNVQDDPLNIFDTQNDAFGDQQGKNAVINKRQHIDTLGNIGGPRQMPGGLRMGPFGINYGEGDYDKDGEKGGDIQLEEVEAEQDEDDDAVDGHIAWQQKEPADRN